MEIYKVTNLDTDESHGEFDTLSEARGCVRFDKLRAYEIWLYRVTPILTGGTVEQSMRVEHCDPYEGDDDRVKQALGIPNASEAA